MVIKIKADCDKKSAMLDYSYKTIMSLIDNRHYRNDILKLLVRLYRELMKTPDYVSMCQCLIFLDEAKQVADILDNLLRTDDEGSVLMAYQIAFDLYESATQQFLIRVLQAIKITAPIPDLIGPAPKNTPEPGSQAGADGTASTGTAEAMDTEEEDAATAYGTGSEEPPSEPTPLSETASRVSEGLVELPQSAAAAPTKESLPEGERARQERLEKLAIILSGETTIELELQFLIRNNHTDMLILKHTKDAVRNSVCHTATVIANSIMHCGTTSDQFLRDNLDWLARAVNWAKFTGTASIGVINKGHEKEALRLMAAYLPRDSGPGNAYTEGGGLYALGLIHANHGTGITDYLLNQLKDAQNEATRHGGCLGLGLAAMGTNRQDVYEQLKFNLYQDDAVTGEAAGIAMGLVMLGSKSGPAIQDMISYAQETQHEKILRGLAIGISMTMFGRLEEADALIDGLCMDKDAFLRRSGIHTIAMAYCGTGNNKAIRRLLHIAASDTNDDVRRAAVEAIGFILFRQPEQCPSVVSLLSESYNPHVRCGAAMALGIACADTGNKDAVALLEPMTNDSVNYVRQGALIASALVLIQQTEGTCPKVKDFRAMYSKIIADKYDDVMAKFCAIIAQGIIDASGRNVTISLQSRTGHTNVSAVVGMLVFTQFWYWYPLAHFISLAFKPTSLIGLNSDLKMPKIEFRSNARPSLYGYPAPLEEKKEKVAEKVTTAVLSITAKHKKKEADKKDKDEKMDVDESSAPASPAAGATTAPTPAAAAVATTDKKSSSSSPSAGIKVEDKKDEKPSTSTAAAADASKDKATDAKDNKEGEKSVKKEPEPNFELLQNPARCMRPQLRVVHMTSNSRYRPMKELSVGGIILLRDSRKTDPEDLVQPVAAGGPKVEEEKEPDPPEPFEYIEEP